MHPQDNPFATPAAELETSTARARHYGDASKGQRILNLFIDYGGFLLFSVFLGALLAVVDASDVIDRMPDQLFGIAIMGSYYVILETLTGRTLGKLITGTKVVTDTGQAPTLGRVLLRTLCRFVPFEAFSFLGSSDQGWHDTWSKTRVVRVRPNKYDAMVADEAA